MDLVDYEDLVAALLWRHLHLLCNIADIIHRVVGGGVELDQIERVAGADCAA